MLTASFRHRRVSLGRTFFAALGFAVLSLAIGCRQTPSEVSGPSPSVDPARQDPTEARPTLDEAERESLYLARLDRICWWIRLVKHRGSRDEYVCHCRKEQSGSASDRTAHVASDTLSGALLLALEELDDPMVRGGGGRSTGLVASEQVAEMARGLGDDSVRLSERLWYFEVLKAGESPTTLTGRIDVGGIASKTIRIQAADLATVMRKALEQVAELDGSARP